MREIETNENILRATENLSKFLCNCYPDSGKGHPLNEDDKQLIDDTQELLFEVLYHPSSGAM